jgi:putative membrane protein
VVFLEKEECKTELEEQFGERDEKIIKELQIRDYLAKDRTDLANERTLLAYIRTFIGLIVSGVGLMKFTEDSTLITVGYVLFIISPVLLFLGFYRFFYARNKIKKASR